MMKQNKLNIPAKPRAFLLALKVKASKKREERGESRGDALNPLWQGKRSGGSFSCVFYLKRKTAIPCMAGRLEELKKVHYMADCINTSGRTRKEFYIWQV